MPAGHKLFSRNPLRRTSDRIQAWSAFLIIMTLMLVSPWAGWYVARGTYRDEVRTAEWQRLHRFQVQAVLLEDPYAPSGGANGQGAPVVPMTARASWSGPGGAPHAGTIVADQDMRAGSKRMIWVDERGAVASSPMQNNPVFDALLSAVLVAFVLIGGLAGLHRIVVWRLNRRRMFQWQAEWMIIEPLWRHR